MPVEPETQRQGFWKRFSNSLEAGRQAYVADLKEVFGRPALDAAFWDDLEASLIGADVVATQPGSDPGAVACDAVQAARDRGADTVIIDTAGRLHTRTDLMEELRKVRRVLQRLDQRSPQETLAVLDAHIGQNSAQQVKVFQEAIGLTGLAVTKMDGSAKAGVVLGIEAELAVPVKLVGIGEGLDDLNRFDPEQYLDALLRMEESR